MEESESGLTPQVDYVREKFFQTTLGKVVFFGGILSIIALIFILDLFNVISILPLKNKAQIQDSTMKTLSLLCPVSGFDCGKTKPVKINNQPATGFELPKETKILNPINIVDTRQFIQAPFDGKSPIGLNQSFVIGNQCYTITYTVPSDASIARITALPIPNGFQLMILGSEALNIDNSKDLNMVMQLQRRTIPDSDINKTDQEKCPVYNLKQDQYGPYQNFAPSLFKNN